MPRQSNVARRHEHALRSRGILPHHARFASISYAGDSGSPCQLCGNTNLIHNYTLTFTIPTEADSHYQTLLSSVQNGQTFEPRKVNINVGSECINTWSSYLIEQNDVSNWNRIREVVRRTEADRANQARINNQLAKLDALYAGTNLLQLFYPLDIWTVIKKRISSSGLVSFKRAYDYLWRMQQEEVNILNNETLENNQIDINSKSFFRITTKFRPFDFKKTRHSKYHFVCKCCAVGFKKYYNNPIWLPQTLSDLNDYDITRTAYNFDSTGNRFRFKSCSFCNRPLILAANFLLPLRNDISITQNNTETSCNGQHTQSTAIGETTANSEIVNTMEAISNVVLPWHYTTEYRNSGELYQIPGITIAEPLNVQNEDNPSVIAEDNNSQTNVIQSLKKLVTQNQLTVDFFCSCFHNRIYNADKIPIDIFNSIKFALAVSVNVDIVRSIASYAVRNGFISEKQHRVMEDFGVTIGNALCACHRQEILVSKKLPKRFFCAVTLLKISADNRFIPRISASEVMEDNFDSSCKHNYKEEDRNIPQKHEMTKALTTFRKSLKVFIDHKKDK